MQSRNRIINYVITLSTGVVGVIFGLMAIAKSFHWCYLVYKGEEQFDIVKCLIGFSLSLFILGIGYIIIKSAQKS
jgi:hypothetical protein